MQQLFVKRPAKAAPLIGNPALTAPRKYGKILPVAADVQCATVAQLVEQLTRNEQVACSNQVSSSKNPAKLRLKRKILRDFSFQKIEVSEKPQHKPQHGTAHDNARHAIRRDNTRNCDNLYRCFTQQKRAAAPCNGNCGSCHVQITCPAPSGGHRSCLPPAQRR